MGRTEDLHAGGVITGCPFPQGHAGATTCRALADALRR